MKQCGFREKKKYLPFALLVNVLVSESALCVFRARACERIGFRERALRFERARACELLGQRTRFTFSERALVNVLGTLGFRERACELFVSESALWVFRERALVNCLFLFQNALL